MKRFAFIWLVLGALFFIPTGAFAKDKDHHKHHHKDRDKHYDKHHHDWSHYRYRGDRWEGRDYYYYRYGAPRYYYPRDYYYDRW